jgi:hypothetical protein
MRTALVKAEPAARGRTWRPWTIWVPCLLALIWSGLLVVGDVFADLMGSWDTPAPGLGWIKVAIIGHCVLAGASVVLLVTGLGFPSWRRVAAVAAWMIIPVGLGWALLTARLLAGS